MREKVLYLFNSHPIEKGPNFLHEEGVKAITTCRRYGGILWGASTGIESPRRQEKKEEKNVDRIVAARFQRAERPGTLKTCRHILLVPALKITSYAACTASRVTLWPKLSKRLTN